MIALLDHSMAHAHHQNVGKNQRMANTHSWKVDYAADSRLDTQHERTIHGWSISIIGRVKYDFGFA